MPPHCWFISIPNHTARHTMRTLFITHFFVCECFVFKSITLIIDLWIFAFLAPPHVWTYLNCMNACAHIAHKWIKLIPCSGPPLHKSKNVVVLVSWNVVSQTRMNKLLIHSAFILLCGIVLLCHPRLPVLNIAFKINCWHICTFSSHTRLLTTIVLVGDFREPAHARSSRFSKASAWTLSELRTHSVFCILYRHTYIRNRSHARLADLFCVAACVWMLSELTFAGGGQTKCGFRSETYCGSSLSNVSVSRAVAWCVFFVCAKMCCDRLRGCCCSRRRGGRLLFADVAVIAVLASLALVVVESSDEAAAAPSTHWQSNSRQRLRRDDDYDYGGHVNEEGFSLAQLIANENRNGDEQQQDGNFVNNVNTGKEYSDLFVMCSVNVILCGPLMVMSTFSSKRVVKNTTCNQHDIYHHSFQSQNTQRMTLPSLLSFPASNPSSRHLACALQFNPVNPMWMHHWKCTSTITEFFRCELLNPNQMLCLDTSNNSSRNKPASNPTQKAVTTITTMPVNTVAGLVVFQCSPIESYRSLSACIHGSKCN